MRRLLHDYLIRQVPLNPGLVVESNMSLLDVVESMKKHKTGCVVMMDGDTLTGIFTERDVVDRVVLEGVDWSAPIRKLATLNPEVMTWDKPLRNALYLMRKKGFRHVPVFMENGKLRGVLSVRNVIKLMAEHFPKEVMNLPPKLHATAKTREGG